jgi:hypothetical protein
MTYLWFLVCQNLVRTSVLHINSSTLSFCPQAHRQILIMYHCFCCFYNGPVVPLSNPILLRVVRNNEELPLNSSLLAETMELPLNVLSAIT